MCIRDRYYGGSSGMIYFENQVGNTKEYFQKRGKLHLLASQTQNIFNNRGGVNKQITYGYPISNGIIKEQSIDYLADWLKEYRILGLGEEESTQRMNLHMLRSPRLIQEMIMYNDKDNFDGVMGFLGCIIGIREKFNQYKQKEKKQEEKKVNNIIDSFRKDDFILNKRKQYNQSSRYTNKY